MKELLFTPFQKYSESKLLVYGIVISVIGIAISNYFNVRLDGVLDVHFAKDVIWKSTLIDSLIDISCLIVCLFIVAQLLNKKTRFVDVIVTVLIARTPVYLLSFFNVNDLLGSVSEKVLMNVSQGNSGLGSITANEITLLAISGMVSILITIWYVALLYNGYKVASNAKGGKAILLFSLSLLIAEVVSKVLIYNFN